MKVPAWLQTLCKPRRSAAAATTVKPGHQTNHPATIAAGVLEAHQSQQVSGSYGPPDNRIPGGHWKILCSCGRTLQYRGDPDQDTRIHSLHQVQEMQATLATCGVRL